MNFLATSNIAMSQVLLPAHRVLCRKWDSTRLLHKTTLISIPNASHSISNAFVKLGKAKTCAEHNFSFTRTKVNFCSSPPFNSNRFGHQKDKHHLFTVHDGVNDSYIMGNGLQSLQSQCWFMHVLGNTYMPLHLFYLGKIIAIAQSYA